MLDDTAVAASKQKNTNNKKTNRRINWADEATDTLTLSLQECHMTQKVITFPILDQFVSNLDTKQILERCAQWKHKFLPPPT